MFVLQDSIWLGSHDIMIFKYTNGFVVRMHDYMHAFELDLSNPTEQSSVNASYLSRVAENGTWLNKIT